MMLGLIILVIVIYYVFNSAHFGGTCFKGHPAHRQSSPQDILDERYARGEVEREEYLERKRELSGRKQSVSLEKQ
ncbi:SHOCT domain-containing protein [Desulfosporosinus sp. PR]|uniref:SHOCT domain-containing protein n=1 Tax=Candidatus Desulfosporosinus nitrosoreducens TaxID=3401928 RepID=UPI0027FC4135|nr:SHOCT domain-containing protein [Desulfosporosinus sp. PR]MDQ7093124.1 SHOCT domain-containing protein [Desulfosporosinus sp. PR]